MQEAIRPRTASQEGWQELPAGAGWSLSSMAGGHRPYVFDGSGVLVTRGENTGICLAQAMEDERRVTSTASTGR